MKKLILIIFSGILFLFSSESSFATDKDPSTYKASLFYDTIPGATQAQKDKLNALNKKGVSWGEIVANDNTINDEQKKWVLGQQLKAMGKNYSEEKLNDYYYNKFKNKAADFAQNKTADKEKEKGTFVPADTTVQAPAKTETSQASNASSPKKDGKVEAVGMVTTAKNPATESKESTTKSSVSKSSSSTSKCSEATKGLFGTLLCSASEIFVGMRTIVFIVSGFGIMAVAIGGFFGQLNWKWLSSIIIGLFVISTTSAIINYMVDSDAIKPSMITDTMIAAR